MIHLYVTLKLRGLIGVPGRNIHPSSDRHISSTGTERNLIDALGPEPSSRKPRSNSPLSLSSHDSLRHRKQSRSGKPEESMCNTAFASHHLTVTAETLSAFFSLSACERLCVCERGMERYPTKMTPVTSAAASPGCASATSLIAPCVLRIRSG